MIGKEHVRDDAAGEHELDIPSKRRRAATLLLVAWTGNALSYVAIYVLIPLLAQLANLAGVGTLVGGGMITSAWSFMRFAGFVLAWVWVGWHYKGRWLIGAQVVLVASFFFMLTVHHPAVFVATQMIFGLAVALVYSSALYYAMHVSSGHGGHAGIHEALIGLGTAVGPAIGALAGTGEIGQDAVWRIALGVTAVLAAGTLVMAWMAWRIRNDGKE
jgi:MFS family permease